MSGKCLPCARQELGAGQHAALRMNCPFPKPTFSPNGFVTAEYGSNERYELQAASTIPVSDYVAVRLGADFMEQRGGDFLNT